MTDLNTRFPSKPQLGQLLRYVSIPRHLSCIGIEPACFKLLSHATHPGQLSLRELARCDNAPSHRLGEVTRPIEVRPQLPITDRAHGGTTRGEIAACTQRSHLIQKSRLHHGV